MPYMSVNTRDIFAGDLVASTTYSFSNWIGVEVDNVSVMCGVATMTRSGVIQFRFEGRLASSLTERVASMSTLSIAGAITPDKIVNLSTPKVKQIRVGVRADTSASLTGSPCNVYSKIYLRETV